MKNQFATRILLGLFLVVTHAIPPLKAQSRGIGASLGGSLSEFDYGTQTQNVSSFDSEKKAGGTGGIQFNFDLGTKWLKLTPELFLVQNGGKEYYTDFNLVATDLISRKVSLNYTGLHLPFVIFIPLGDNEVEYNGFVLSGSLFGDYAIGGTIEDNTLATNREVGFNSDVDRFDYGYGFKTGFVASGFSLLVGYSQGIKNIEFSDALLSNHTSYSDGYKINNSGFTLTLGYWLMNE